MNSMKNNTIPVKVKVSIGLSGSSSGFLTNHLVKKYHVPTVFFITPAFSIL